MHSGFSAMLVAIVMLGLLILPAPSAADGQLSKYRVGHTTLEIVLTGSLGERRPIDVDIWYPARKADFEQAPLATYTSRLHGVTLDPARWDPLTWQVTS